MHLQIWSACLITVIVLTALDLVLKWYAGREYGLFLGGGREGAKRDIVTLASKDIVLFVLMSADGTIANVALLGLIVGIPLALLWGI